MLKRSINHYLLASLMAVLVYSLLLYGGTAYLQEQVVQGLIRSTGASVVQAQLRPALPFGLLFGKFQRVHLELQEIDLGPLTAETIELTGEAVDVGLRSIRQGRFTLDRVAQIQGRLDITEAALNAYFQRLTLPPGLIKAVVTPELFLLSGELPIMGRRLEVDLQAKLTVLPGNILQIVPVRLAIQKAQVPPVLIEQFLADYLRIPIDLTDFPVPLVLQEVVLSEGRVSVYAGQ